MHTAAAAAAGNTLHCQDRCFESQAGRFPEAFLKQSGMLNVLTTTGCCAWKAARRDFAAHCISCMCIHHCMCILLSTPLHVHTPQYTIACAYSSVHHCMCVLLSTPLHVRTPQYTIACAYSSVHHCMCILLSTPLHASCLCSSMLTLCYAWSAPATYKTLILTTFSDMRWVSASSELHALVVAVPVITN